MSANIIFVLFSLIVVIECEVPDYIQVCHRDDPQLADCIKNSVYTLLPRLKVGIPELEIPSLEPLHLKNVTLNTGTQAAHIATNLTDIQVWNASRFTILELTPKISKNYFRFKVQLPQLHVEGNYEIDSRVLVLQLKGKGRFHINITDYHFDCIMKGEKVIKDDEERLLFENMKLKIGFTKGSIILENLYNGDPVLGKATNDVINENLDVFFEELRPNFEEALSKTFTDISNKITLRFNYKELFP